MILTDSHYLYLTILPQAPLPVLIVRLKSNGDHRVTTLLERLIRRTSKKRMMMSSWTSNRARRGRRLSLQDVITIDSIVQPSEASSLYRLLIRQVASA